MDGTKEKTPTVSRKKAAQLKKLAEKKEKNKAYYEKNREKLIKKVQDRRHKRQESAEQRINTRRSIKAADKRNRSKKAREESRALELERRAKIREQTKERVRKHRAKKKRQAGFEEEIHFWAQQLKRQQF